MWEIKRTSAASARVTSTHTASRHVRSTASWAECCTSAIDIKTKGHLIFSVPGQGTAVLELLASGDQAPLVRGDTLLVMDLSLDIVDGVSQAEPARDRLAGARGLEVSGKGLGSEEMPACH